jgi:ATP-dependent exoDNAse (exonuclease V) beta subunit
MTVNKISLSIVPAGAGSGKTHHIQEELTRRIKAGLAPEKIVAVTFTEAAAAELRGRIRAALVKEGLLDEALRLDQAYISTIHGFGLRLITEFAFDGGASPAPRLLNDDEQSVLVSQSLARSEAAFEMMQKLSKYGYSPDFNNNKSAEQVFRETILRFISTLRSIGCDSGADNLGPDIEKKITALYGETQLAEHLKQKLLDAVQALLQNFPHGVSELSTVAESVKDALQKEFRGLNQVKEGAVLDSDWNLWKQLGNLKTYKNPAKYFPDGYQELAEEVLSAAASLPLHPGPLQEALKHADLLLQAAVECLGGYAQDKEERSLLDFTDMVARSRSLLCENTAVLECLRERVDCLVIDEFQDTNPLQFSLLWALTRTGVPTIIVGDLKQAIMGFQGADARLLKELCTQYADNSAPLPGNWRTTARLMDWINHVGAGLFGSDYDKLEPRAEFTSKLTSSLELVDAEKSLSGPVWASYLVNRLHTLLNDDQQNIYDKASKGYRRLKGGDIAILCPTKNRMAVYADALRNAGIRCRIQQNGWFSSRIIQLASYALAYVADSGDLHAKLYLAVTELGNQTLESALQALVNNGDICDPELHGILEGIASEASTLRVDQVLAAVIKSLDLYGRISEWEDAAQARANLLRLQEECRAFSCANRDTMACGGYYGSDIKTFLAWLRDKVKRDDGQPDALVLDEDAVQLVTWHSSKGREWPIVAVCGMDDDFTPRLPATRVAYNDFSQLGALLDKVRVDILPNFDSSESNQKFMAELLFDSEESATRLLYVALTRSREKLILEWPSHHEKSRTTRKNKSYWDLLTEKTAVNICNGKMMFGEAGYDYYKIATDNKPWTIDVLPISVKHSQIGCRAIVSQPMPADLTPEAKTPSSLEGTSNVESLELRTIEYGRGIECAFPALSPMERGNLLHRAFELLSYHPERALLLPDAVGLLLEADQALSLIKTVSAFDNWLAEEFSPLRVSSEIPILALDANGTVMSGNADMIIETADALWVIDHKSDIVEDKHERFIYYLPQLECYSEAISKSRQDKPVKGIAINWVSYGIVSLMLST